MGEKNALWKNTKSPEESLLELPVAAAREELVNLEETKGSSLEADFSRMASSVGTKCSEGWKRTTEGDTVITSAYQTFMNSQVREISKYLWSSYLFFPEMKELAFFKNHCKGSFTLSWMKAKHTQATFNMKNQDLSFQTSLISTLSKANN